MTMAVPPGVILRYLAEAKAGFFQITAELMPLPDLASQPIGARNRFGQTAPGLKDKSQSTAVTVISLA
jgi:hypothetical protein